MNNVMIFLKGGTVDTYQYTIREGDLVRLPGGALGIVTMIDIICCGHVKEVVVYPLVNCLHHLWLSLIGRTCFYDKQINRLKKLPAA